MQLLSVEDNLDTKLRDSGFLFDVEMPNLGTELGLSVGLSASKVDEPNNLKERPVQLNLLPLRPLARKASVERNFVSIAALDLPDSGQALDLRSRKNSLLEIDVNQRPATDSFEHLITVASTTDSNITSLFQCDALRNEGSSTKRGREAVQEFDSQHEYRTFELNSSRGGSDEEGGNSRKKLRLAKEQSALLEDNFKEQSTLNPKRKNALAKQLNLTPRQVEVWFQNRRARTKLKQTEVDCEFLKCCWENLTEENRRLHKELQDLRALKVAQPCVITHDFRMPLPATTLTMCPSCERLTKVAKTPNVAFPDSGFRKHAKFSAAC